MPLAHRRTPLLIALAVLSLLVAFLAVPPGRAGAAVCGTANAALGRPATASSTENATFPAGNAVDGNPGTRWSSAFSDPQWVQVDLGDEHDRLPGDAQLGGGVRAVVPDPGRAGRERPVDDGLRHHDRHRRHPDPHRERHRPVRPDERHRAGHPVRATRCGSSRCAPAAARRRRRPRRVLGRHRDHPAGPERGHGQGAQPHQRPLPGQPGVLELQRADPLDRRAAVPRHAGELGRPDVLLPRHARPASTSTSSSSRSGRTCSTATPPGSTRFGLKLAMRLHAHDGYDVAGRRGPGDVRASPGRRPSSSSSPRCRPSSRSSAQDPGAVPDPVPGQPPVVPGRRGQRRTTSARTRPRSASPPRRRTSSAAPACWPRTRTTARRSTGTSPSCRRRSGTPRRSTTRPRPAN